MTLFFLSLIHFPCSIFKRAGKFCCCYINSESTGCRVKKEGREEREKKASQKLSVLWENEKGSGTSKTCTIGNGWKLVFIRSGGEEEEQKSRRKLEAEWRWLSSSLAKSLEERELKATRNKALNGLVASRTLLRQKRDPALDQLQPDMSFCWKDVFFVNMNFFLWFYHTG